MYARAMKLTAKIKNQSLMPKWEVDTDGFLRCFAAVLRSGVMGYDRSEILESGVEIPAEITDQEIKIYISPEELADAESLRSAEGKPVVQGHVWQDSGNGLEGVVGNAAGNPVLNLPYLYLNLLITQAEAVVEIMNGVNDEISCAYFANLVWENGVDENNVPYVARQINIRYNHYALIPVGTGRAGTNVKILNKQNGGVAVENTDNCTSVQVFGKRIRVHNQDVGDLNTVVDDASDQIQNAIDPAKLTDAMSQLDAFNQQISDLTGERDTIAAQLSQFKEQLEAALNPDNISDQADQMVQDRQDATDIATVNKVTNTDFIKKLHGHALKKEIVNQYRIVNSLPVLSDEVQDNHDIIGGRYSSLLEISKLTSKNVTVKGGKVVDFKNKSLETRTTKEIVNHRYGSKK